MNNRTLYFFCLALLTFCLLSTITEAQLFYPPVDYGVGAWPWAIANWRAGYTNLDPGENSETIWNQNLPVLTSLVGINQFRLVAEDVTPAPYNQVPYPPAGDTETSTCTLTANAP